MEPAKQRRTMTGHKYYITEEIMKECGTNYLQINKILFQSLLIKEVKET